jgi:TonB family protein
MAVDLHRVARGDCMLASPKRSALLSGILHAVVIVLVLLVTSIKTPTLNTLHDITPGRDVRNYISLVTRPSDGGGGGGSRAETRASKGEFLRASLKPFVMPAAEILNDQPRISMEAAVLAPPDSLPMMPKDAVWGLPDGLIGKPSSGLGSGGGIGDEGRGGGVGNKNGRGAGDGENADGITGRPRQTGVITAPLLLYKTEPEYTEEARRAKLQGTVVLYIEVNERGIPQNISVQQSLGLGLDERAVESVKHWKFRPGQQNNKPAVTTALVHVTFRLL